MAKRECIGKMNCPECGFPDAEVKPQKTDGLVYRWCPDCNAQYFCRTPEASSRLLAKIGKSPVTEPAPEPAQVPATEKKPDINFPKAIPEKSKAPPKIASGMAGALQLLGVK